jgi:branched-subunit amino acid ABC-type transport system permease component
VGIAIEYLLNGLQAGLLLFVVAAGLTVSFGLMRVINLSHGSFYMLGAFVGLTVAAASGSFLLGMLAAAASAAAAGFVVERTLFARLYVRGPFAQMLVSFGLIFVFDEMVRIVWGPEIRSFPRPEFLGGSYDVLGARVEGYRLFLIGLGLALSGALLYGLLRTPLGMAIQAGVDDREAAELVGLDVRRLFSVVFCIGAALAGIAGFVAVPLVNAYPGMGDEILIAALVVVVMGGLGSVAGSLVASIVIGLALTVGQVWIAGYSTAMMYAALGLVLLVRPRGLMGQAE